MFSIKSSVFSIFELLNQTIFFEQTITKSLYRDIMILMWRFKSKLTIILWDFMKLHFVRILLSIWSHFINFTRWATDEITGLDSIIFARSIKITSSSPLLQSCMNRTCWSIFLSIIITSRLSFSIDEITSILEQNESQSLLMSEFDI